MAYNFLADSEHLIQRFENTFNWLQQYDEQNIPRPVELLSTGHFDKMIMKKELFFFKQYICERQQSSEYFIKPIEQNFESILNLIEQTSFGQQIYPDIASKAAHLLYFIVKNHPFYDGNKRSAAFLFVYFLEQNDFHYIDVHINEMMLTILVLWIAESRAEDKENVICLIINFIHKIKKDRS